jgi:hypothetical protein
MANSALRKVTMAVLAPATAIGATVSRFRQGDLEQPLRAEVPVDVSLNNWHGNNCQQPNSRYRCLIR